jgi:inhibitor of cysteine peptidase
MLKLDESSNGQEIELQAGQELEIRLPENPTTGFRWHLGSRGDPTCRLLDDFYEADSDRPGSGGSHYWRFQAAQTGFGAIVFVYKRSWEREEKPVRRFALGTHVSA